MCACQSSRPDSAREYIRLTAALGERDAQSLDYYYGPKEWVGDVKEHLPSFAEIAKEGQQLADRAGEEFLRKQARAVAVRASMLGGKRLSFDEEAAALFDLPTLVPIDARHLDEIRLQIARLLPGQGSIVGRYDSFQRRLIVPQERMDAVMDAAVNECQARTIAHIDLPPEESIYTQWVQDRPWAAFSRYEGNSRSRVQWNADFGLTVDRALQLACHETYPGHHVHSILIDQTLVRKRQRLEFLIQPTFSPQSFLSEALASYAADLAFTLEEREHFQRNVLYPAAGLDASDASREFKIARLMDELELGQVVIAHEFLDGHLEFARAEEALEQEVLMAHAAETLKYLNQYRSYMLGYTIGKAMARTCFDNADDKWKLLRQLLLQEASLSSCAVQKTAIRQIQ